jgi:hypothetical protein
MGFIYGCGQKVLVILITIMRMRQYDAGRIAQWSTSRASLEATGCRHRASVCAVSPQQPPWSTNTLKTHKTPTKNYF